MKKITIFGADGRTGSLVVKEAIEQGYSVTAFVYSESARDYLPKDIEIVQGDVMSKEDVSRAVDGCDVVVSVVGHIKGSDPLMQTKGIENITQAMKEQGVDRIISLTGTGVREEGDKITVLDRVANFMISKIDPERVNDGIKHTEVLKGSGLDWTVLRVLKLSNEEGGLEYKISEHGPVENLSHRNRVAKVLVDLINNKEWLKKSPILSK
jgi:putative NADH-flavin reductase